MKSVLPQHTFLQYTATPQGNLLINLIDVLSASWAEVLQPGDEYVGGSVFFAPNSPYVTIIPPHDTPDADNPEDEAPQSLCEALQLFFVGAASGYARRNSRPPRRSMMVHPTRERTGHQQYFRWVQSTRSLWMGILDRDADDPDRIALEEEFRAAHANLAQTVADLEPFERLRLIDALRRTEVKVVNSDQQARGIRWTDNYSWILVGGQMLDRGFTVEGLTVTYMPRGPGVGNADTIQQRARFLGYKQPYLGFCRVFLENDVADAYRVYVVHEEHLRDRLMAHNASGAPLSEFRRVFLLDRSLRPTRTNIYEVDYVRPQFDQGFFYPKSPHENEADRQFNAGIIAAFLDRIQNRLRPDDGHPERTEFQHHLVATGITLQDVYEGILLPLRVTNFDDNREWVAALEMIALQLDAQPGRPAQPPSCAVFKIRPNVETRRATTDGKIDQLFQGAHPDARGAIYPGDRGLHPEPITVQIHRVTLTDGPVHEGRVVARDVPIVAIWLAPELRQEVIVQNQQQTGR